ncbi:YciI family protein [Brevibacillus dissolubilis]|uniref:YciI family protein n=1 Tax=Brevibacillus dissolubilis TaxID=1844116 RepID=UPI0011169D37|nr:YciI family protein [Brevibacillus dissolubilis]
MTQEFLYLFKPKRENFLQTLTPEEMAAMGQHAAYTQNLHAAGKIIQAGACLDGSYGIVVFRAESLEEATEIFEKDPAVQAGIVYAELHPYRMMLG